nr:MAG TPA: hypothetical protein [Caudoviricetes sp.]
MLRLPVEERFVEPEWLLFQKLMSCKAAFLVHKPRLMPATMPA